MTRDRVVVRPYGRGVYGVEIDGQRVGLLDHYREVWGAVFVADRSCTLHQSRAKAVAWLVRTHDAAKGTQIVRTPEDPAVSS